MSSSTTTTTCADSTASHSGTNTCTVTVYEYCGGGIYIDGDDPEFSDVVVEDNTLPEFEQYTAGSFQQNWLYSYGGGICARNSAATFDGVDVMDNFADQGGGIYVTDSSIIDWTHSYVANNEAGDGGGVNADGGTFNATNVLFAFNTADTDGGGLFTQNGAAPSAS